MMCISLVCFMISFAGVTALRLSATNQNTQKPFVAVMIVGRQLTQDGVSLGHFLDITEPNYEINKVLCGLTGEDESISFVDNDTDIELADKSSNNEKDDILGNIHDIWGNIQTNLIFPLNKTYNVDTILCVDGYDEPAPLNVQVHTFPANDQVERWRACLKRIVADKYEWIIKTRPDYFYYKPIPHPSTLNKNYIYTRFRLAGGIKHLTSEHFSWDYCNEKCNADGIGYVNDDMLFFMPASLVNVLNGTSLLKQDLKVPESWIPIPGWEEGQWTRKLIDAGILSMPLAAPGFPRHDRFGHRKKSEPCAYVPIAKHCSDGAMKIFDVHKTLQRK